MKSWSRDKHLMQLFVYLVCVARQDRILDILPTNNPTSETRVMSTPPIERDDHDIVLVEYDINAKRVVLSPRKVFLCKRTDMQGEGIW